MMLVYPQLVTGADLLRGINKLNYVAPLLQRRGAKAAAIVNSKLYGVRSFYKVMKKYGIHPVIGLSIKVEIEDKAVLLYIYAKDDEGYRNLLKMSSAVSIRASEILPLQWLEAYSSGCVVICPMTDHSWDGLRDIDVINKLVESCAQGSLTVGIARSGGLSHDDEAVIEEVAATSGVEVAAVYESRFTNPEDAFPYKVAQAIRTGEKLADLNLIEVDYEDAYIPEEEELHSWFADKLGWIEKTSEILLSCRAELPPSKSLMPIFPVPEGESAASFLSKQCEQGLINRLGAIDDVYRKRMRYELSIINDMGFADYFLIVEDFMQYATNNKILTGPGRGSSAGSLVAFALRITDVDPIHYGLVFERFLNPERITMPDIDIDFADDRRIEVIDYVAKKYGKMHVAQIITFGTLSARSVVRNVTRVFGYSTEEMGFLSKEIPNRPGITLSEAYNESKGLRDWIEMDPLRSQMFDVAKSLEGLPRNASTHAAGIILSPTPLVDTVPLQDGGEGIYLTQWPMDDVEEQGLLKMDFLGLRNLTLLDRIRTMIYYGKGYQLDFEQIPLDDKATFDLFKQGDMSGVFQFESDGMRDTLKLIQPDRFEDLFAISALYRPGPMDNIPLYAKRKQSKEGIAYIHPSLEAILEETYGVIIYQEQIMQIAVKFAGYTLGEADLLRRAISKKNHQAFDDERIRFIERAVANGMQENIAQEIYDLIVKFADYGFPKSHAVAYSLISYRLAYLKANEPTYFYAALLSSTAGNSEKTVGLIREVEARNIELLPPSITRSKYTYTVEKNAIRIGLGTVRGVTRNFYNLLRVAKNKGNWKTMFDFAASIGSSSFTDKAINPLIKAGALDEFGESRSVLLASVEAAIAQALFSVASPKYSPSEPMPQLVMLEYEKETLGFYLSEHPAVTIKNELGGSFNEIISIEKFSNRSYMKIVGLIIEVKRIRTKNGEAMAFVTVQDESGEVSCTFFPKQYALSTDLITKNNMVRIEGTVERQRGRPQILVQKAEAITETYT